MVCKPKGVQYIFHYLDDFIVIGSPDSHACENSILILKQTCADLGVPLPPEKQDGPTSVITFLGITVNTVQKTKAPTGEDGEALRSSVTLADTEVHHKNRAEIINWSSSTHV